MRIGPRAAGSGRVNVVVEAIIDQIEHFFVAYNRYEGREFVPRRRRGPAAAARRLQQAVRDRERS